MTHEWMHSIKKGPIPHRVGNSMRINQRLILYVFLALFVIATFALMWPNPSSRTPVMHSICTSIAYNSTYPLSRPTRNADGETIFRIAVITDLDKESAEPKDGSFISYYQSGALTFSPKRVTVDWEPRARQLKSTYSLGGRGMELSELVVFNGKLLSFDDRTGIIFELVNVSTVVPWVIVSDGDGRQAKGFKIEWAAVKEHQLYVGGLGKEWTTATGDPVNHFPQYVKIIDQLGHVTHLDWKVNYNAMKEAAGLPSAGYMIHEAAVWSRRHNQWFFLPRRASRERYNEEADEVRGTNLLVRADATFTNINVRSVGTIVSPLRGFSSMKFIPGFNDRYLIALKSEERNGRPVASYLMVMDVDGNVLLPETRLPGPYKYEGIEFV